MSIFWAPIFLLGRYLSIISFLSGIRYVLRLACRSSIKYRNCQICQIIGHLFISTDCVFGNIENKNTEDGSPNWSKKIFWTLYLNLQLFCDQTMIWKLQIKKWKCSAAFILLLVLYLLLNLFKCNRYEYQKLNLLVLLDYSVFHQ